MNYSEIRRLFLKLFIGFLSLTALVAILCVLGGEFGATQWKVLATTFSISAGSICAMSCAAFIEKRGAKGAGLTGILAAALAVLMVVFGVWAEMKEKEYWQITVIFIVAGIAFAHGCLLRLPKLAASYGWTQKLSTALIGLLALQIILADLGEISDPAYYRLMAALSVVVVLVTLVVPICSRLDGNADKDVEHPGQLAAASDAGPEELVLRRVSGVVFADQTGRKYQVTEIKPPPEPAPKAASGAAPPAAVTKG